MSQALVQKVYQQEIKNIRNLNLSGSVTDLTTFIKGEQNCKAYNNRTDEGWIFSKKVQKNKASQFLSFLKKFDIEKCPIHVNIEFVVHTAEPSGKGLLDYIA